jgi:ABC-type bacteriocin/lantibiotic exporter with double-glycine peptidase domain
VSHARRSIRAAAVIAVAALASACMPTVKTPARDFDPVVMQRDDGWVRVRGVPEVRQHDVEDCGAAVAAMVLGFWRRPVTVGELVREMPVPKGGLAARDVRILLKKRGLRAYVIEGTLADLEHELAAGRPVIVGTTKAIDRRHVLTHYEVVVAWHPEKREVVTLDPAEGWRVSPLEGFELEWAASEHTAIVALPPAETAAF